MTEQDIKNFKVIDGLVKDYFSLDAKSYKRFHEILLNPEIREEFIMPELRDMLGPDHRVHFEIPNEQKMFLDDGWNIFIQIFDDFIREFNVSYKNYLSNKIKIKKQEVKLFKFMRNWYSDKDYEKGNVVRSAYNNNIIGYGIEYEEAFKRATEKIGTEKLPERNLYITVSFNFADWFMVSTAETWSSCLNLQSDYESCFWSGLPGLIVDPNRVLFYISDGKSKSYRGITVSKFVNRTWGIISDNSIIYPVRFYPQEIINREDFSNLLPFKVSDRTIEGAYDFYSKHSMKELLYNKFGESVYIYQDYTRFDKNGAGDIVIRNGSSGYHKLTSENRFDEDTMYDYCEGLDGLISSNMEIYEHENVGTFCSDCGDRHHEDDMLYGADDQLYCESCYSSNFTNCYSCGESLHMEDAHFTEDGESWCETHFFDRFFYCDECGVAHSLDEYHEYHDEALCSECYSEQFIECEGCGKTIDINEIESKDGEEFCHSCFVEKNEEKEEEEVA